MKVARNLTLVILAWALCLTPGPLVCLAVVRGNWTLLAWAMLCVVGFVVVDKVIDRLEPVEQQVHPVQTHISSFTMVVKDVPGDRLAMIITNTRNGHLGDVLELVPLRRGNPMTHGVILANVDGMIYVLCKDGLYRGNLS